MHLKSAAVGMFLVCYYPLFALSLLYKIVDPTKANELELPGSPNLQVKNSELN